MDTSPSEPQQQSQQEYWQHVQRYIQLCVHQSIQHEFQVIHQRIDAFEHRLEDLRRELELGLDNDTHLDLDQYLKQRDAQFKRKK